MKILDEYLRTDAKLRAFKFKTSIARLAKVRTVVALAGLLCLLPGCFDGGEGGCTSFASPSTLQPLSGGKLGTVGSASIDAFARPMPGLSGVEERQFFKGRALFRDFWVPAPASTESRDGLGPHFNARSCEGCHVRDGRGRPPIEDGEILTSMLLRLSVPGSEPDHPPMPEPTYGSQLQPLAIDGVPAEAVPTVRYEEVTGNFLDGETFSLRNPTYVFAELGYGPMARDLMVSPRVAPAIYGLGLLAAIPDQVILSQADPEDVDSDGISGRPNYPFDVELNARRLGRFGWKANQPTIRQQVAGAFLGDMGLTSSIFIEQDCSPVQESCNGAAAGGNPELAPQVLDNVVFYSSTLAVPKRRKLDDPAVEQGAKLFNEAQCAACHTPQYRTSTGSAIAATRDQIIHPYTDLLLHDMGEGLADNRPDFEATGREWRTAPLWGLGLLPVVNGHTYLLHDGRARNVEEAILWHGGEAQKSREFYRQLPAEDRQALLAFLESL